MTLPDEEEKYNPAIRGRKADDELFKQLEIGIMKNGRRTRDIRLELWTVDPDNDDKRKEYAAGSKPIESKFSSVC